MGGFPYWLEWVRVIPGVDYALTSFKFFLEKKFLDLVENKMAIFRQRINQMKLRILIFICSFLLSNIIFSQNEKLDERGGFKSIKLGTELENFTGFIIKNDTNGLINGVWFPSDDDLHYLFDLEIDFFELEFDNKSKKLVKIIVPIVEVEKIEDEKYNYAKTFISTAETFTTAINKPSKCEEEKMLCWWFGSKVAMKWSYEANSQKTENSDFYVIETLKLIFMDIPYFKNKVNKGF